MRKLLVTAILLVGTCSTLSFAQQTGDFTNQGLNLTKDAQDLKEAILNDVKVNNNDISHVYLSNLKNLKFPIFAREFSDESQSAASVRATVFCKLLGYSRADQYSLTSVPLGTEIASLSLNNNLIDAAKRNVQMTEYTAESEGFSYMFHKLNRQGRIDLSGFNTKREGSTSVFWTINCIK